MLVRKIVSVNDSASLSKASRYGYDIVELTIS
jgi:hypothetical protein